MCLYKKISKLPKLIVCVLFMCRMASAEDIGFDQAWNEVQKVSNLLAAERANVDSSKLKQDAVKSMYAPRVDLIGTFTQLDSPVEANALDFNPLVGFSQTPVGADIVALMGGESAFTTQVTKESFANVGVNLIWPVYTGGRITAVQDIMAAQTDIAENMLDTQNRSMFEGLVRIYFGVVLAEQNLATHAEAESGLEIHLDHARKLEEQGQIAKVGRLTVEAAHDRSKVATARAQRGLEIAQITLQQLLHRENAVSPADELFINGELPDVDVFISNTLSNSPLIRTLEARDDESQAMLKAERGRYHPEVFLFADYDLYQDNSIASDLLPDWQAGVGVSLTLVDRINRSKTIKATRKTQEAILELELAARRGLMVATQVAYKEAQQALEEYNGLRSSLELAEENLHLRTEAFSQGFSTSVELVDAQLFIASVKTVRSAAAYQYVVSLARLLSLTGETDKFESYRKTGH